MTKDERREQLDYLREKEEVCGLDRDEIVELEELLDEFEEELSYE